MKLSLDTLRCVSSCTPGIGEVYPASEAATNVDYWLIVAYDKAAQEAHCLGFDKAGNAGQVMALDGDVLTKRPLLGTVDLSAITLSPTTIAVSKPESQPGKPDKLGNVELGILAHHGYMSEVVSSHLTLPQKVAYKTLGAKGLLEVEQKNGHPFYVVTERGRKHLDAIQALELP